MFLTASITWPGSVYHYVTTPLHPSPITPAAVHSYWETFITRQPRGSKAHQTNQISGCSRWEVYTLALSPGIGWVNVVRPRHFNTTSLPSASRVQPHTLAFNYTKKKPGLHFIYRSTVSCIVIDLHQLGPSFLTRFYPQFIFRNTRREKGWQSWYS